MDAIKCRPEVKKKWLEALRSEEYDQTKGCLRDEIGFCCLGVLVDLHAKEDPFVKWQEVGWVFETTNGIESEKIFPLEATAIWAIETNSPEVVNATWQILSTMNDNENKSFKAIASFIEENL